MRGLYRPGVLILIGAVIIAATLVDSEQSVVGIVVGALILGAGLVLLARGLPGIGQWRAPRARVRATPEGIVFEGEVADTTVPWSDFSALSPEVRGSNLIVWLVRSNGERFPVPTLSRRGLLTEGARVRALAEVERVRGELVAARSVPGADRPGIPG